MNSFLLSEWNKLSDDAQLLEELEAHYSEPGRFYHTLVHIEAMLKLINLYEDQLRAPNTMRFAVWYHDVIYNARANDNEAQSADFARQRMTVLGRPEPEIDRCVEMILATKSHTCDDQDFDLAFLLDIDLSILAAHQNDYQEYCNAIRREYYMYPEVEYNMGRKKVLKHFIAMPYIYKTTLFREIWENKARKNLNYELTTL